MAAAKKPFQIRFNYSMGATLRQRKARYRLAEISDYDLSQVANRVATAIENFSAVEIHGKIHITAIAVNKNTIGVLCTAINERGKTILRKMKHRISSR
jgi:hypothetical protein